MTEMEAHGAPLSAPMRHTPCGGIIGWSELVALRAELPSCARLAVGLILVCRNSVDPLQMGSRSHGVPSHSD